MWVCQPSVIIHSVSHTYTDLAPSVQYPASGTDTGLGCGWCWSWSWIELAKLFLDPHDMKQKGPRGEHWTCFQRANKYVSTQGPTCTGIWMCTQRQGLHANKNRYIHAKPCYHMCVWWKHTYILDTIQQTLDGFSAPLYPRTHSKTVTKQRSRSHRKKQENVVSPNPSFPIFPLRDVKWNHHLFSFPSSQPSFVPLSPLQLILIFYMFEITKKSFMLETHTMPFSPPGCDCTCGIELFSLMYCGVTFVLCGMVLR